MDIVLCRLFLLRFYLNCFQNLHNDCTMQMFAEWLGGMAFPFLFSVVFWSLPFTYYRML